MSNEASSSSSCSSSTRAPRWVQLPPDIITNILQCLGVWRVIDLKNDDPNNIKLTPRVLEDICRVGVDRSQAQLLKLGIENFGNTDLLRDATSSDIYDLLGVMTIFLEVWLYIAAKNFPLLEKLDIYNTSTTKDDIESVGRCCPLLKSLILHDTSFDLVESPASQENDKALAIAKNMPELRHLSFRTNNTTYEGLQAIFEACPHLESPNLDFYRR